MPRNQPFEDDLLREAEGLELFVKLFQGFDRLAEELLEKYGGLLDSYLIICIESIRYDINVALEGEVPLGRRKVRGLVKQLDEVMADIETFQAGVRTKPEMKRAASHGERKSNSSPD